MIFERSLYSIAYQPAGGGASRLLAGPTRTNNPWRAIVYDILSQKPLLLDFHVHFLILVFYDPFGSIKHKKKL